MLHKILTTPIPHTPRAGVILALGTLLFLASCWVLPLAQIADIRENLYAAGVIMGFFGGMFVAVRGGVYLVSRFPAAAVWGWVERNGRK